MPRPLLLPMPQVRRWTTAHVALHPKDLTHALASAFGVTRAAAAPAIRRLESEAFIVRSGGQTRPVFAPGPSRFIEEACVLPGLDESALWERHFAPFLSLPPNVQNLLHYGLTEMVNNANDHSGGHKLTVRCAVAGDIVYLTVIDDGIGVFERLGRSFGLSDYRLALLELSKGRVTTDPSRHTGEGIFFTSRAFRVFRLEANGLVYERRNRIPREPPGQPLINLPAEPTAVRTSGAGSLPSLGTRVCMALHVHSPLVLRELFAEYTTGAPDDLSFNRTVIPVRLARLADENLLSRSQAKRLLAGVERFKVVELDFDEVPEIGQAFADEIFRVFAAAHPDIVLRHVRAGPGVLPMILRVRQP